MSSSDIDPDTSGQTRQIEQVHFDGIDARVFRGPSPDLFIAFEPPDAKPFVSANFKTPPEEIVAFVNERLPSIRDLRADMVKHFSKTSSLECRFQTGDVAYLLGRPFMIRVYPEASGRKLRHAARGRANTTTTVYADISLVNIFVIQVGSYDQRRFTFMKWASAAFAKSAQSIVDQASSMAGITGKVPGKVQTRPMRGRLVKLDPTRHVVWMSEDLLAFPPICIGYAFMNEMARELAPLADGGATPEEREQARDAHDAFIERGCPSWRRAKKILDAENSPYRRQ
jgi:predicted metal-dependent hydrolase